MRSRVAILFLLCSLPLLAQINSKHVEARLIADQDVIQKGEPFRLGLHLKMLDHWHTYWENPGSSGLPTTLKLTAIPGLEIGPLRFPVPKTFVDDAGYVTYGYDDEVLLIAEAVYKGNAKKLSLSGQASWLECKEICIPGDAEVALALNVADQAKVAKANQNAFASATKQIPTPFSDQTPFTYESSFQFQANAWQGRLQLTPKAGASLPVDQLSFLPLRVPNGDGDMTKSTISTSANTITIDLTYEPYVDQPAADMTLEGVVTLKTADGPQHWRLPIYPHLGASKSGILVPGNQTGPTPSQPGPPSMASGGPQYGFWLIMLFAFIGGFILNLMPCVLPVLSLKIFSLISEAGSSTAHRVRHAWIYTLGIAISFLTFSLFFIGAKSAGSQLGIGFQFQSPAFVIAICALIFVMALSFFGVFHLEPPNSDKLYRLTQKKGWQGAFFQGALMTLLSTPCTAPLLGTAYGWALSQSNAIIIITFQVVAFGLAFPYVLLAHSPALMKFFPKPGAWMNHLKIGMGFLLAATLIWLVNILSDLTGKTGVSGALTLMLFLAAAAYIFGATFHSEKRTSGLLGVTALTAFGIYFGLFFLFDITDPTAHKREQEAYQRLTFQAELSSGQTDPSTYFAQLDQMVTTSEKIAWVPYTPDNLNYFREQNRLVFMDFTATWCNTCKANEALFINTAPVREAFAREKVVTLKVDYTNRDDEITKLLADFGRAGVPLYVVYPGSQEPIVLPEAINKSMILDSIERAQTALTQKTRLDP